MTSIPDPQGPILVGTRIPQPAQVVLGKSQSHRPESQAKSERLEGAGLAPLSRPLYFVALLLVTTPMVDLLTNVWPLAIGDIRWRYGAVGLLSGFLVTPLIGIVIATVTAVLIRQKWVAKVLFWLNVSLAILLLSAAAMFVLDVLQLRVTVPLEGRAMFDVGAIKALAKHGSLAMALAGLAYGARKVPPLRS